MRVLVLWCGGGGVDGVSRSQGDGSPQGCLANFFPEQGEWGKGKEKREREIEGEGEGERDREREKEREIGQPGRDVEVGLGLAAGRCL